MYDFYKKDDVLNKFMKLVYIYSMRKFTFIFIFSLVLMGCNNASNELIEIEKIFLQDEMSYHVLFFLDSCMACRNIKLTIKNKKMKVYYINLMSCSCLNEDDMNNEGVNTYSDIKIKIAPTLLLIENKVVSKQIKGYKDCREYLIGYKLNG